jgi:hypothetical protein
MNTPSEAAAIAIRSARRAPPSTTRAGQSSWRTNRVTIAASSELPVCAILNARPSNATDVPVNDTVGKPDGASRSLSSS